MNKSNTYKMAVCAIMAAVMCILGPMSIPIGVVPVSFTNLVIYFAVYLLGTKGATVSYMVYMLLGIVGLPVFSAYQGGIAKVAGPTGGYLVGFIFMAIISGIAMEVSKCNVVITGLGMILGTIVAYVFGTAWFVFQMECSVKYAVGICVMPFLPFDFGKIVIASILGVSIRKALINAELIEQK